jgi:hypothetical protein
MRRGRAASPWPTAAMAAALAQAFQRALWPRRLPGGVAAAAAAVSGGDAPLFAAAASTARTSLVADAAAAARAVMAGLGGRRPDVVQCLVAPGDAGDRAAVIEAGRAVFAALSGGDDRPPPSPARTTAPAFFGGAVGAVYDPATRTTSSSGVAVWAACLPPGSAVATFSTAASSLPSLDGDDGWPAFLVRAPGDASSTTTMTTTPSPQHDPQHNTVALVLADVGFAHGAGELARRLTAALPPDAAVAAGVLPPVRRPGAPATAASVLLAGPTALPPPGARAVGVLMRAPRMAAGCVSAGAWQLPGVVEEESPASLSSPARVGRALAAHATAGAAAAPSSSALVYATPGAWRAAADGLAEQAGSPATLAAQVGGTWDGDGEMGREVVVGGVGDEAPAAATGAVLIVRAV